MYFRVPLAICTFILLSQRVSSIPIPCNCGLGRGTDICQKAGCYPLVVRPQPLTPIEPLKPRIVCKKVGLDIQPLKPIGDLCSCGQNIVKPAVVPRPACGCCSGSASASSSCRILSSISHQIDQDGQVVLTDDICNIPSGADAITIVEGGSRPPYAEADAVSQAIAYRKLVEQQNNKAERKLSMGFQTLPRDVLCTKKAQQINEGNLLLINGEILEYKRPCAKASSEEIELELPEEEEEEEEEPCVANIRRLSLGDLGYGTVKDRSAKFIDIQPSPVPQAPCGDADLLPPVCCDGYRGGQVIIKEGPVNPGVPLPVRPPPCEDDSEIPCPIYPPLCRVNYKASTSSCSKGQSNVFFETLSC